MTDKGLNDLRSKRLAGNTNAHTLREWHMWGYRIRVDGLEPRGCSRETEDWLYVEPEETRERYPIPSAFAAYLPCLDIVRKQETSSGNPHGDREE